MANDSRTDPERHGNRAVGALVGAVSGAVLRFLVAVSFLYYVYHWGGPWWGKGETELHEYRFTFVSAGIGLVIGGIAGATCRPVLAALLGAVLSAGCCAGLFVVPVGTLIKMSGPNTWDRVETLEILGGLLAMTVAGGLAGGIGATVGARTRKPG
jgi:hypothetical protein